MTALASAKWSAETISWNLGEQTSYLELGTPDFTTEQMEELEKLSNEAIRAGYNVTPSWHSVADVNEGKVQGLRKSSKKLPESVLGPVRVVTIAQVDTNTCFLIAIFFFTLFLIFYCPGGHEHVMRDTHAQKAVFPPPFKVDTNTCCGTHVQSKLFFFPQVDTNTCCGTHVQSTAHLQAVKLLRLEKGKASCKVHFSNTLAAH